MEWPRLLVQERFYDNSPPQNQRYSSTNVSWLLDTSKDTIETEVSKPFLVCKRVLIDDIGVSRDTILQETRPGAGVETGDFDNKMLMGATVERLEGVIATLTVSKFNSPPVQNIFRSP